MKNIINFGLVALGVIPAMLIGGELTAAFYTMGVLVGGISFSMFDFPSSNGGKLD